MIEVSTSENQTLAPGQSLIFDRTIIRTGKCECHRANSPAVKMCSKGCYAIYFDANVTGDTADTTVFLTVYAGGEPLPETLMASTPSAANTPNHVSTTTRVCNCCGDYSRVTVVNSGTTPIVVGVGAHLILQEV